MSLHLIELPDDLVAWIKAGHFDVGPPSSRHVNGKPAASILIERAITEPMECRTCRWWRSYRDGEWGECARPGIAEEFSTDPDDTCSLWEAMP